MITNQTIIAVEEMIKKGLSCRVIARRFGISRTTVSRIARHRRRVVDDSDKIVPPQGNIQRCPICGARTQLPCVYCQIVEKLKKRKKYLPEHKLHISALSDGNEKDRIRIELTGEQRRRYEEIHRWRTAQPNPHFTDIPDNWPFRASVSD